MHALATAMMRMAGTRTARPIRRAAAPMCEMLFQFIFLYFSVECALGDAELLRCEAAVAVVEGQDAFDGLPLEGFQFVVYVAQVRAVLVCCRRRSVCRHTDDVGVGTWRGIFAVLYLLHLLYGGGVGLAEVVRRVRRGVCAVYARRGVAVAAAVGLCGQAFRRPGVVLAAVGQSDNALEFVDVAAQFEEHLVDEFVLLIIPVRRLFAHRHDGACRRGGRQVLRQHGGSDFARLRGDGHVLRQILELAYVARPRVGREHLRRRLVQTDGWHVVLLAHLQGKLAEEQQDIVAALAQGRQRERYRAQAVVEVLAKLAVAYGLLHVDVGGGDDAYVRMVYLAGADGDELPRLQHAQQAGLCGERQLAHLVEE